MDWVTREHVEVVQAVSEQLEGDAAKRMAEVANRLALAYADRVAERLLGGASPRAHGAGSAREALQALFRMGLVYQVLNPQLSAEQVAMATEAAAMMLARADVAALTESEQEVLDWVFDQVAEQAWPVVRNVECKVRAGIGLPNRADLPPVNVFPA